MAFTFGAAERHICGLFAQGNTFIYSRETYTVLNVGKPTCSRGEPKTDIYLLARSQKGVDREFKISFKKENADFLENKTNAERAEQLFGPCWQEIITNATTNLFPEFNRKPLIYKRSAGKTEAGAITMGWKFELLNVPSGQLSGDMCLSPAQVLDVYAGTNLTGDKRDAMVNGWTIPGSGIANFILFEESPISSAQEVIDSLIPIRDYVRMHPTVYFACKALNYRTFRGKYDGNRPLSVFVDWDVVGGKLYSRLNFETPLLQGGDYVYDKLSWALRTVGAATTDDLNANNVFFPAKIWD